MPMPTVSIKNSENVMAQLQPGMFFEGRRQNIRVIGMSEDRDSPENVRKGLIGLVVPTIFTKAQMTGVMGVE